MKGLKKRIVLLFLIISTVVLPLFSGLAFARTAYVERNDTIPIENVTIALQSAMQIYQKYVLTNLDNLKSIKGLGDLGEIFGFLNDVKEEFDIMLGKLKINDMIKLDELTKEMGGDFSNILLQIGEGETSLLGSIGSMFGINDTITDLNGITGAIISGKIGGTTLAGGKNDLNKVAKEKGLGGAATEAVSRTSQTIDKIAEKAASGSDIEQAIMSGYSNLLKAVPMIHPEIASSAAYVAKNGLDAYTDDDTKYFQTFLADASKAMPLAAIMELLDRHMSEKSPYSKEKYQEKIVDEIAKIQKELEDIAPEIIELESPETKTTRLMGVIIRQNELTLRQYETLAVVCADNIKMNGIIAGLKTTKTSDAITQNTLTRITHFNQANIKMKEKYLKDIGIGDGE